MKMPQEDIDFCVKEFLPELKKAVAQNNLTILQAPDIYNSLSATFRTLAAFPFQETYVMEKSFYTKFVIKSMKISYDTFLKRKLVTIDDFNAGLDHFSTLPYISPLNKGPGSCKAVLLQKEELEPFPGRAQCVESFNTRHSIWHAQSARGIQDFFKLVDEFVGKQDDILKEFPEIEVCLFLSIWILYLVNHYFNISGITVWCLIL